MVYLRQYFTFLVISGISALLLLMSSCWTPYRKVETIKMGINTLIFSHHYDSGYSVSIIGRKSGETATVSGKLTNTSRKPITIKDRVALYVDGKRVFQRSNAKVLHTLKPGESVELSCDHVFRPTAKVGNQVVALGQQLVFIEVDSYQSPAIYLDLSPDTQVAFRFAKHL